MLGQTRYITFATAGELWKWQVTGERTADPSGVMEGRSPVPSYAALRSIERTGGSSAATRSQLAPASSDR
jgi:hypothetical protein